MKEKFSEFYNLDKKTLDKMWEDGLFVFDANVLLGLYRYSQKNRKELFKFLNSQEKKIWVPFQFAFEYHENRLKVIGEQEGIYQLLIDKVEGSQADVIKSLNDSCPRHPVIKMQKIVAKISKNYVEVKKEINKYKEKHPKWTEKDSILEEVSKLFKDKIGDNYNEQKLDEIKREGEKRYSKDIPPGYKDGSKVEARRFGDLIGWFQVIDKAKEAEKPILFITDERKDDWWRKVRGKTIGPRHELIKEMKEKTGQNFHMYTFENFLEYAKKVNLKVSAEVLEEARELSRAREESSMKPETNISDNLQASNFDTLHNNEVGLSGEVNSSAVTAFDSLQNPDINELSQS